MARTTPCPKCRGVMKEGFVLDNAYGSFKVSAWIEGAPQPSVWSGLKLGGRRSIAVATFRCDRCGYLESYAKG